MKCLEDNKFEKFSKIVNHELRTSLVAIESGINAVKHYLPKLIESYHLVRNKQPDVPSIQPNHLAILSRTLENVEREARFSAMYLNMVTLNMSNTRIDEVNLSICHIKDCIELSIANFPSRDQYQISVLKAIELPKSNFEFKGDQDLMVNVLMNLILGVLTSINCKIEMNTTETRDTNTLLLIFTSKNVFEQNNSLSKLDNRTLKNLNISLGLEFGHRFLKEIGGEIVATTQNESLRLELIFPKI
jgi:signal transduction histidine kinase